MSSTSDYTFFICSTLNSTYGSLSFEERYQDTIESLMILRNNFPDSLILFVDNSNVEVDAVWRSGIDVLVTEYYQLPHNLFSLIANEQKLKSASEANMMEAALNRLQDSPYCKSKRIFKLSGRYRLSDEFDITKYDDPMFDDKYAFVVQQYASTYDNWKTQRRVMRLETALVSWSPSLTSEFRQMMGSVLWQCLTTDNCIEEALFQHVPHEKIVPLHQVYVEGRKAEDRAQLKA